MIYGLRADVKDANTLLPMMESTAEIDYISLDGETQAQKKYSPANFIKKYCMTVDVPSSIASGETVKLTKGYYKGIVFNIPGAEVLINGEWIPFTAQNEQRIKQQNPMNLEWRLNSALYKKMGYNNGQKVSGTIIAVDDQWNGLSITKDFSVQVK